MAETREIIKIPWTPSEPVNTAPTVPASITYSAPVKGETHTISWAASTDSQGNAISYSLERQVDSGAWEVVISSLTATSYVVTAPETAQTICYRVRATDGSLWSDYKTGTAVSTITPTGRPSAITYDTPYAGESLTVSWGAVTDSGTVTYTLEQSTDGGTTWEQVATGSNETSYEATVPTGKPSICYRVKATGTTESEYSTGMVLGILQDYQGVIIGKSVGYN